MTLEPLGEVGANFSLQLSSRTQFTKINNNKVIAENQCEKHKKIEFKSTSFLMHVWNEVDLDLEISMRPVCLLMIFLLLHYFTS